jgi:hypothetical protein
MKAVKRGIGKFFIKISKSANNSLPLCVYRVDADKEANK